MACADRASTSLPPATGAASAAGAGAAGAATGADRLLALAAFLPELLCGSSLPAGCGNSWRDDLPIHATGTCIGGRTIDNGGTCGGMKLAGIGGIPPGPLHGCREGASQTPGGGSTGCPSDGAAAATLARFGGRW